MTSIDSTVLPEPTLVEEYVDAVIQDNETYVSKLNSPKMVFITPQYADTTVVPSATISGRTITFHIRDCMGGAYATAVGFHVLIKGRDD